MEHTHSQNVALDRPGRSGQSGRARRNRPLPAILLLCTLLAAACSGPAPHPPATRPPDPPVQETRTPPTPVPQAPEAGLSPALAAVATPLPLAPQPTPGPKREDGRLTVLLLGTDNRPGEPVGRTDTIIVLTVNTRTGASGMLSIARDTLVRVPGLGRPQKINTVHVLGERNKYPGGGPALLRETIADLIGYQVDYYVRVNFQGFRQIIDQLGGIDIDVPRTLSDPTYPDDYYGYDPLYIRAGRVHMDGALALKYARTRHVDNDYGRERRQQQVLLAIKNKLLQPEQLLALAPRLPGLVRTMSRTVETDIPVDKMLELAYTFQRADLANPVRVVVDSSLGRESTDPTQGWVLIPDVEKLRAAAARVFGDGVDEPS